MEKIQKNLKKLRECNKNDNETVHCYYDDVLSAIAEYYAPEIKKEADNLVKEIMFWYA